MHIRNRLSNYQEYLIAELSRTKKEPLPAVLDLVDRLYELNHLRIDGSDGWSEDEAVRIKAPNPRLAVAGEYFFLMQRYGLSYPENESDQTFRPPWRLEAAMFFEDGGHCYEILTIAFHSGEVVTTFFDVTELCRMGMTPRDLQDLHVQLQGELKIA